MDYSPGLNSNTSEQGMLVPFAFDYISAQYLTTEDIYTYKTGGSTGTTVAVITVTWMNSTKQVLSTVERT
jgi:hypothetical protein